MSPRHLERMFEKLIESSLEAQDWRRASRAFKAKACGFDCEARLRLNVFARGSTGPSGAQVGAEFEIFLMHVGGEPEASVFAAMRCNVLRPFFPSLLPLYQAVFTAAEMQLRGTAAFQALDDRRKLEAATPASMAAPTTRRSGRL